MDEKDQKAAEQPQIWDRQRDPDTGELEPAHWFHRFEIYLSLGPDRTREETWRKWKEQGEAKGIKSKRPSRHWCATSKKWRWSERAEAWDVHIARKVMAEEEAKWMQRRVDMREWEWRAVQDMRKRIEEMLRFPLAQVTQTGDDGTITIIRPTGWRQGDIARFVKEASQLGRLATQLETSRDIVEVDFKVKEFLDALPSELREPVRRHLVEELQRRRAAGGD